METENAPRTDAIETENALRTDAIETENTLRTDAVETENALRTAAIEAEIADWSDHYFLRSRKIVAQSGDADVRYAVFLRRPCISAPRLVVAWLEEVARARGCRFDISLRYAEGKWVGAGEPIFFVRGPLSKVIDAETLVLQKLGPACIAAYNAASMCTDLPNVSFLAMDCRHCAGTEMAEMMSYGASVGSARAQRKVRAKGFVGNATAATCKWFGQRRAYGTMPHALIGYAGSTVRAAELFAQTFPGENLTVLVDYFGREVRDSLAVCRRFSDMAHSGRLSLRLDTPGSRFVEGLDPGASYAILERCMPECLRGYRNAQALRDLVGPGVSAAAVWHLRGALYEAGFGKVSIVASSGFGPAKCRIFSQARAPVDVIGTGSFIPELWHETYATADIIAYNGEPRVKAGREFLLSCAPRSGAGD